MKKGLIALVLACGIGFIAFASFSSRNNHKQSMEKKTEKKHECKRRCMFS